MSAPARCSPAPAASVKAVYATGRLEALVVVIPDELVALTAERRLIPFVGAGFSAALNLPSWESILRDLCLRIEGALSFDELSEATGGDYLQIAEYLFLKSDRHIGPIRHQLERSLAAHGSPVLSGPHVELVNLGAAAIYTTNYDDLVETTYRSLGLPVTPVVLAKDVALADTERTQVVKYHGDLKYEQTLVLTESAYYRRLDFESPMDLKFRSDLLGRSVLFMGYSFRDVNIRIIWFKLMQMMKDIPEADRRPSYIVRVEPNPALDELYAAVGLRTIILNPGGPVTSSEERVALLGRFLLELSLKAWPNNVVAGLAGRPCFASTALLEAVDKRTEAMLRPYGGREMALRGGGVILPGDAMTSRLMAAEVPEEIKGQVHERFLTVIPLLRREVYDDVLLLGKLRQAGPSQVLTEFVVRLLAQQGDPDARARKRKLLEDDSLWPIVWQNRIDRPLAEEVLASCADEAAFQARDGADDDIAYLADIAARIAAGQFVAEDESDTDASELEQFAKQLLVEVAKIYPSAARLAPTPDGPPVVADLLAEVKERAANFEPVEIDLPARTFLEKFLHHRLLGLAK